MTTPQRTPRHASAASVDEIERDVERTRAQLGETAGALAHKLDAKSRAKERLDHARRLVSGDRTVIVAMTAAGAAALVIGVVLWRRNS
jgi:hypothetical protein